MNDDSELRDINYNLILLMSELTRTIIVVLMSFFNEIKLTPTETWIGLVDKTIDLFYGLNSWLKNNSVAENTLR